LHKDFAIKASIGLEKAVRKIILHYAKKRLSEKSF